MAAKKKHRIVASNGNETALIVTPNLIEAPWWSKLSAKEHKVVLSESQGLRDALLNYGQSKLAIGQRLASVRDILSPHGAWLSYLRKYNFKIRTAQRFVAGFKNAQDNMPEVLLKEAMALNMNMIGESEEKPLGVYTDAVAALPPPSNMNETQARTYLGQIENLRKHTRKAQVHTEPVPADQRLAVKVVYKTFSLWLKRIPQDRSGKARMKFISSVVGMILTEAGVASDQGFSPQAVPPDFKIPRGRKPGYSPKASAQQQTGRPLTPRGRNEYKQVATKRYLT